MLPRLASRITPAAPVVRIGDACWHCGAACRFLMSLLVCQLYASSVTLSRTAKFECAGASLTTTDAFAFISKPSGDNPLHSGHCLARLQS